MSQQGVSRRQAMQLGLGAAAGGLATFAPAVPAAAEEGREAEGHSASVARTYSFLGAMMDAYAQGPTVRLAQSYADQQGLLSTAFTYDNAQAIHAFLVRGRAADRFRARVLGDGLLYAQQHDPAFSDGRLRQAYFVDQPDGAGAFIRLALAPFFFLGSAVGDLAWAGIALAHLHAGTGEPRYREGARALGQWIFDVTHDTRGPGGYNFGVDGGNNPLTFKSTEHNIDAYALFTMLAALTGDGAWIGRAQHARDFVAAMWNPEGGFFWTGTGTDGASLNRDNIPADTQTWSFMALRDHERASSIEWAKTHLATTDTPQTINSRLVGNLRLAGSSYASLSLRSLGPSSPFDQPPDPSAVWLEGTSHLAAALRVRRRPARRDIDGFHGDLDTARDLLETVRIAQDRLGAGQTVGGRPLPAGQGVVAASSVLNTGFGFSFYPNRHLAASAWYALAAQSANPFRLGF